MEVIIQPDPQSASRIAAHVVAKLVRQKPQAVLGLATGSTPVHLYKELTRLHLNEGLDFSGVTTFNLDEYVGLSADHPASYHRFMGEHLFDHINVAPERIHIPDGMTEHIPGFCEAYERAIRAAGGIDLQILGIGVDGHIGFNEATSSLASRTRLKTLTERTRQDNAHFFQSEAEIPHHVITMGVGTIMESRCCVLLAFGAKKADAVARAIEGPVTAMLPASILQMHRVARFILDDAAASMLTRSDYYREVYAGKPDWQRDEP